MRLRGKTAMLAVAALVLLPYALAATNVYLADGLGDDWAPDDLVGVSIHTPFDANATVDLTGLSAADNATHWFFKVSFVWVDASKNATLALYLFGPDDGSPALQDPLGHAVTLPPGAPLRYAVYLEVEPGFPASSKVAFFDGVVWKNRTFVDLGISAARNDTAAFVELSAPRDSLTFLQAGSAAVALLITQAGSPGAAKTSVDTVPDDPAPPRGEILGRVRFFDYAFAPPIAFTALGLSDPFAVDGDGVTIFVELTNMGPKNASGISAQVLIDGVVLGSREGLGLMANAGTAVLAFDWRVTSGAHTVTARSFPGGPSRSLSLNVPGAVADLSITETTVRPPFPSAGEEFAVDVRVRNDGSAASGAGSLLLKDGTLVLSTASLPAITPGESAVVSMPARIARSGSVLLRVEIDGANSFNSTAQVEVALQAAQPPLGVPAVVWLVVGVAAIGAGAWFLTPRLVRGRFPPKG